jgi:hypothetical protein
LHTTSISTYNDAGLKTAGGHDRWKILKVPKIQHGVLVVGGSNPLTPTNPSSSAPQHGLWSFFVTLKNGKIPPKMDDTDGRSFVFWTTSIMII